jgi:hypothetical protein
MTLEQLQASRQSALTHLNTVRRARASIGNDIRLAAQGGAHVAPATLELHDYLSGVERRADEAYGHASKLVDLRLAANAELGD